MPIRTLEGFVRRLSARPGTPDCANPYYGRRSAARRRRQNLRAYLQQAHYDPATLAIGEAPGYKGCAWTGVPFTSEQLLFGQAPPPDLAPAAFAPAPGQAPLPSEQTATLVRDAFRGLAAPPLCWNACPLHPHQPGRPQTNRPPRATELAEGRTYLLALIRLMGVQRLIAIGRKAERACQGLGLPIQAIPHPAYGRKQAFRRGLQACYPAAKLSR
jgi:uracil-DNA glycosylase